MTVTTTSRDFEEPEDAFVARIRAGDAIAWRALFARYYVDLVMFARRYLTSDATAEDVVQDVLARVWDRRDTWAPESVRAYLYGATRNRALNIVEHQVVEGRYAEAAREALAGPSASDGGETDVREYLDGLTERQYTALVLRFEHGMKHAEIAAALGISLRGAEQLVMRALRTVRERGAHR